MKEAVCSCQYVNAIHVRIAVSNKRAIMPPMTYVKASFIGRLAVHRAMPTPISVLTPLKVMPTAAPMSWGGIPLTGYFSVGVAEGLSLWFCIRDFERLVKYRIIVTNPTTAPTPEQIPVISGAVDQRLSNHQPIAAITSTVKVN